MPDEALLSELCSLCYAETPKYRCPRCKTRTCSLPCYKKHQQRASCNGKRDPAEYLKKRELATPAGIDRDYNYLKSVERDIEHANKDTKDRGINGRLSKSAFRGITENSNLQKYLIEHNINVQSAPRGMSRQKNNQTRTTLKNNTLWTVEWSDAAGVSELQHGCMGSESIDDLYATFKRSKRNAEKRGRDGDATNCHLSKKRRNQQKLKAVAASATIEVSAAPANTTATSGDAQSEVNESKTVSPFKQSTVPADTSRDSSDTAKPADEKSYFYLLKPATAVGSKVLIPLDTSHPLTTCLKDRCVPEYPTVYVLPQAQDALPTGFILEEQYLQLRKREEDELREAMHKTPKDALPDRADAGASSGKVDPNKILDMLKRDISR